MDICIIATTRQREIATTRGGNIARTRQREIAILDFVYFLILTSILLASDQRGFYNGENATTRDREIARTRDRENDPNIFFDGG